MAEPADRVQVIKQESAALGGNAADDVPYDAPIEPQEDAIEAAGLYLQDASNRDEVALIWREGDDIKLKDGSNPSGFTLSALSTSGGGITEGQHEALDTLTHMLAETGYVEVTRSGGLVTTIIAWETSSKLKKLREMSLTRTSGLVSQVVLKLYDGNGAELTAQRITVDFTRSGGLVVSYDITEGIS